MTTVQPLNHEKPVLIEPDLRLRRFTLKDANELLKLHQDSNVTRFLLDDVKLDNLRIVTDFIYGLTQLYKEKPGLGIWAFERYQPRYSREQLVAEGAMDQMPEAAFESLLEPKWILQGWFNLTPVPDQPQYIELGSRLQRDAWGQRIACGVGEQVVHYAFDVLKLDNLYLHCHPMNRPALYCAAYLGFSEPTHVKFQGSEALKLSATQQSALQASNTSDSARRRQAVARVNQWTSSKLLESA